MLKELLTGLGAGCEFFGILLVAAPELFPRFGRSWTKIREGLSQAWRRLLRLFGRRQHITVSVGAAGAVASGGRLSAIVSKDPNAPLEEKVAYLLDQDRKTQERLNALDHAIEAQAEQRRREIQAAREALETFVRESLERERDVHIRVRLAGVGFLLVGVPLLAAANVV
jgi:hypothetical protein